MSSQEQSGVVSSSRSSQEKSGGVMRSQEESGGVRRNQEESGGVNSTQLYKKVGQFEPLPVVNHNHIC